MVDFLIVNPNNRLSGGLSELSGVEPPLWAGLWANSYATGSSKAILDAEALNLTVDETAQRINDMKAGWVYITVMGINPSASSTSKMPIVKGILDRLENKKNVSLNGLHPAALGRKTCDELGVEVFHRAYEITHAMPSMPWHLLPMDKYRAHNWHCLDGSPRKPYGIIYTSLGCPFNCDFCNIHALYNGERRVWLRDPSDVIKELGVLVETYGVRNIKIWDELFTFNHRHVQDICKGIIDRGFDLNIWAYARVDSFSEELLPLMKRAGINWLGVGIESVSGNILKRVHKGYKQEKLPKTIEKIHDAGINVMGNFIFGLPDDDMETMRDTLDTAKELKLEYVNFYVAMPYPGSHLYENAAYQRLELPDTWEAYGQFSPNLRPLPTKHLRPEEIVSFRDNAFNEFFSDPSYLERTRHQFGEQAVDQIKSMLKHKIRRNSWGATETVSAA